MNTTIKDTSHSIILGRARKNALPIVDDKGLGEHNKFPPLQVPTGDDLITQDQGHIMTIAPVASDKENSLIIPNLFNYSGPVVVVDPTGDYYTATAEKRRAMGQKVFRLDPFGVISGIETDSINPIDLISLSSPMLVEDCQMLVNDLLSVPVSSADYWERLSISFTSALIGYICSVPEKKSLVRELVKTLLSDDVVYNLAVVLDTIGGKIPPFAYSEISSFLQRSDADRSRILATTYSYLQPFSSEAVLKSLDNPSVPLDELAQGNAVSIYLMVPPTKLRSYSHLLRFWVGTILTYIVSRQKLNSLRTLLILDECAQLGTIVQLTASIPLWERCGLLLWTFWQDVDQARSLYSPSWTTMPTVVQLLATKNYSTALEVSNFLSVTPEDIISLSSNEQIVRRDGVSQRIENL